MKQVFLKREGNSGLLVFFGGWGSSPELFSGHEIAEGYDCLLCFDYSDMDFDWTLTEGYERVDVAAWSMGVWIADMICGACPERISGMAVAFGGTPYPVDDEYGIPGNIFRGTLDGLSLPVLTKFRRRMCGEDLAYFEAHIPKRNLDSLKAELKAIRDEYFYVRCMNTPTNVKNIWNLAMIGERDLVFPVRNQVAAWKKDGVKIILQDVPHYSKAVFDRILGGEMFKELEING